MLASLLVAVVATSAAPAVPAAQSIPQVPGLASPAGAAVGVPANDDGPLFASPTRLDRIGRIVVPVMINGMGPFRFIIDSGASHSTMTPRLAAALGLDPATQQTMRVNGITGTADVPSVAVDRLQAGSLEIRDKRFPVVFAPVLGDVDGILGVAGLKKELISIDFQHDRVTIFPSHRRGAPSGFQTVAAERVEGGLLAVPGRIGRVHVLAIIDTGSERTLGNPVLREALQSRRKKKPTTAASTVVYGATTETSEGFMEDSPPIVLDQIVISRVAIIFGDFHIFDVWNLKDQPAIIIGMDVIGTLRALAIDFKDSKLYFDGGTRDASEGPARPDQPGNRQMAQPPRPAS